VKDRWGKGITSVKKADIKNEKMTELDRPTGVPPHGLLKMGAASGCPKIFSELGGL